VTSTVRWTDTRHVRVTSSRPPSAGMYVPLALMAQTSTALCPFSAQNGVELALRYPIWYPVFMMVSAVQNCDSSALFHSD
jgi:hypothetical protein